jgi:hypothetical protein
MAKIVFDTDSDPGIQVTELEDGRLSFSCQDDWCGDTEFGFGATVNVDISREQVADLAQSLINWLMETA